MKSLDRQSKLMTLVMVYIEICSERNVPNIYCPRTTGINIQNFAVAEVLINRFS